MPQLYSNLQKDLNVSPFFYVTGSPFQLYPFLRGFVQANYPPGPILPKNLTFLDVPDAINALSENGTQEFKLQMIDRINNILPQKQFLMIGDSTERDPETYGQA
jgi:phosphatidate phosphatase APP1